MTSGSVAMQVNDLPSEIKLNWVATAQNKVSTPINRKPMYSKTHNPGESNSSEIAKAETSKNQIISLSDIHKWQQNPPQKTWYLSFFNRSFCSRFSR